MPWEGKLKWRINKLSLSPNLYSGAKHFFCSHKGISHRSSFHSSFGALFLCWDQHNYLSELDRIWWIFTTPDLTILGSWLIYLFPQEDDFCNFRPKLEMRQAPHFVFWVQVQISPKLMYWLHYCCISLPGFGCCAFQMLVKISLFCVFHTFLQVLL